MDPDSPYRQYWHQRPFVIREMTPEERAERDIHKRLTTLRDHVERGDYAGDTRSHDEIRCGYVAYLLAHGLIAHG